MAYIPRWGAIKAFGSVVITLTVSSHKQDFIRSTRSRLFVQALHVGDESLPLSFLSTRATFVRRVFPVNEPKVVFGLNDGQ